MVTLKYTSGESHEFKSIQAAAQAVLGRHEDAVIYDAGNFPQSGESKDSAYEVRNGRAALIWHSEAESENDDGANAFASINVE